MKPNFHNVKIKVNPKEIMDVKKWDVKTTFRKTGLQLSRFLLNRFTPKKTAEGMEHLNYAAGLPPFLAWTILHHVCDETMDHPPVCRIFNG